LDRKPDQDGIKGRAPGAATDIKGALNLDATAGLAREVQATNSNPLTAHGGQRTGLHKT
jgi:hypothetical protein